MAQRELTGIQHKKKMPQTGPFLDVPKVRHPFGECGHGRLADASGDDAEGDFLSAMPVDALIRSDQAPLLLLKRLPRLNGTGGTRVALDDFVDTLRYERVVGDFNNYSIETLQDDYPLAANGKFVVETQPYYAEDGNVQTISDFTSPVSDDLNPVFRTLAYRVNMAGFNPSQVEWRMMVQSAVVNLRRRLGWLLCNGAGALVGSTYTFRGLRTSSFIGQTIAPAGADPTTEEVRKLIARCGSGSGAGCDLLVTSPGGLATLGEVFKSDRGMSFEPHGQRRKRTLHIDGIPVVVGQVDENEGASTNQTSVYALATAGPEGIRFLYRAPTEASYGMIIRPIRPDRPDVVIISVTAALLVVHSDSLIRMEKVATRRA